MKFGELLAQDGIITEEQLQNALELQKDNPGVAIGEILMTQGLLTREQLLAYVEKMIYTTGVVPDVAMEMLDQEEIDEMMSNVEKKKQQESR
jgi:hypothetical protein